MTIRSARPLSGLGANDARLASDVVQAKGSTRLRLGPAISDLYQAVVVAEASIGDIACVARLYR